MLLTLLLLAALTAALTGCGDSGDPAVTGQKEAETTSTVAAADPSSTSSTAPDVGMSEESREYMRELKETVTAAARLGEELEASGAPSDDPRGAIVYGIRARGQAITTLKALSEKNMEMADAATKEMRSLLARGKNLNEDSTPEAVKKAVTHTEELGIPSQDPDQARPVLKQIVEDLEPLMEAVIESR